MAVWAHGGIYCDTTATGWKCEEREGASFIVSFGDIEKK